MPRWYALRQDPDVIMVGEMRDAESFTAALVASETGHLVFSTVHTDTASQTVSRILNFFPFTERDQVRMSLATNLRAVLCQRLIPSIQGSVVPAIEIMINTPTVRKLMEKNQLEKLGAAIETGTEDGMQTFNQAIYQMIKARMITEEEGMPRATNPETLKMNLKGIFLDEARRILSRRVARHIHRHAPRPPAPPACPQTPPRSACRRTCSHLRRSDSIPSAETSRGRSVSSRTNGKPWLRLRRRSRCRCRRSASRFAWRSGALRRGFPMASAACSSSSTPDETP